MLKLAHGKETVEVYVTDGKIVHAELPHRRRRKGAALSRDLGRRHFQPAAQRRRARRRLFQKTASEILDEVKAMTHEWETILEVIPSGKSVFRIADLAGGPYRTDHSPERRLARAEQTRRLSQRARDCRTITHPLRLRAKVIYNLHKVRTGRDRCAVLAKPVVDLVPACAVKSRDRHLDRSHGSNGAAGVARSDRSSGRIAEQLAGIKAR